MDNFITGMNELLKQKDTDYVVILLGKMPVHMGHRENKGFFRNSSHAEKLRSGINEEDDVQ